MTKKINTNRHESANCLDHGLMFLVHYGLLMLKFQPLPERRFQKKITINPFNPERFPIDEYNRLVLDTVKSISVSGIYWSERVKDNTSLGSIFKYKSTNKIQFCGDIITEYKGSFA